MIAFLLLFVFSLEAHGDIRYQLKSHEYLKETTLSPTKVHLLEKINRMDERYLVRASWIIVPVSLPSEDELSYSPLPSHHASPSPKSIVVSLKFQIFGAYENGELVRWGPVSSGRQDEPTPQGLFHLNWKSKGRFSLELPEQYLAWYFNFENDRGLSFHSAPLPGYPASHACLRLLDDDAKWLYEWGEQWRLNGDEDFVLRLGTPVLIFGQYDFKSPPPWLEANHFNPPVSLPENMPTAGTTKLRNARKRVAE